jgi:hydrophobe/amphiphile efflux-3 (HAE3) family protein
VIARALAAVMALAARRPLATGAGVVVLALLGAAAALQLQPSSATDTFVSRSSPTYKASAKYHQHFGDDAVYVLVREPLTQLTLTSDLERILALEGCLSGNIPAGGTPRGGAKGPCARLGATKPVQVVLGPGTFINESVGQIQDEIVRRQQATKAQAARAADAARKVAKANGWPKARQDAVAKQATELVTNQFYADVLRLGQTYGLTGIPQLNDPSFVAKLVFDSTKPAGTPKARFAYLFPTKDSALIQLRLRPGLSQDGRTAALALVRRAVAMPDWRLPHGKGTYVVTGGPVVLSDLTASITDSIVLLVLAALVVMSLVLALVFRTRLRLLPLAVALAAVAITFGALQLTGASLTIASVAVLPVLIGLAVDYAIQVQSRLQEEQRAALGGGFEGAVARVAARGAPTVATAAAATAAGFLVLLLSPVPMVRGFGLLLVAGIFIAFACATTLGTAVLAQAARRRARAATGPPPRARRVARPAHSAAAALRPALRGAGELVFDNPASRGLRALVHGGGRRALAVAAARPGRVLAVGFAVAVVGWALDTQIRVESDIQKLVPQDLPALRDLNALERSTGVGGEVDVVVTGDDLTDPKVVSWMADYQAGLAKRFGYGADRGCGKADLCPSFSLPALFDGGVGKRTQAQIQAVLDAVPPYFSQSVLTPDRRTATLAFGIKLMSLDRQQTVLDAMRQGLRNRPAGVDAQLAGLPVLFAQANKDVSSPWRRLATLLAGLAAVALVLFAALRSARRALVPLIPIALASGWSSLVIWLIGIPLNPMSVVLGALVIAISTEFSVLLAERFRAERTAGHDVAGALDRAYRSTGAAVLASGTTAIAGFAVLVLSDIRMLRDFGAVTVVDLTVSLLGVLVVLPSALVLAERGAFGAVRRRVGLPWRRRRRSAGDVGAEAA